MRMTKRMTISEQAQVTHLIGNFINESQALFGDEDGALGMAMQYVDLYLELARLDLTWVIRENEHDPLTGRSAPSLAL